MFIQTWSSGPGGSARATAMFVHGWLVNGDVFSPLCDSLNVEAQILVPDLVGTGRSGKAPDSVGLTSWKNNLTALLKEGESPVHLVGHSMGGLLAQAIAAEIPELVQSLTLIVPVPVGGFRLPDEVRELFERTPTDLDARREVMDASCVDLEGEERAALHKMVEHTESIAVANGLREWQGGLPATDLSRIACPTLVVGSEDAFLSDALLQEQVAAKISNAQFVSIPGGGHYQLVQKPEELARIIESFAATLG